MRFTGMALAAATALALGGCEHAPRMTDRAVSWNTAVADSTNQVLLLNVIRARFREPMYFTRINTNTTTMQLEPSLSFTIPFSPADKGMTAGINGTDNNQVALDSLSDQEFINGMLTPVKPDHLRYFISSGWGHEISALLFISEIRLRYGVLAMLPERIRQTCAKRDETWMFEDENLCKALQLELNKPDAPCLPGRVPAGKAARDERIFLNNPARPDQEHAVCFQAALRALLLLGLDMRTYASVRVVNPDIHRELLKSARFVNELEKPEFFLSADNKVLCQMSMTTIFAFNNADAPEPMQACTKNANGGDVDTSVPGEIALFDGQRPAGMVVMRSPEGMVYYVGQNLRQQALQGEHPATDYQIRTVEKRIDHGGDPIFVIAEGISETGSPVSVLHRGRRYSIPPLGPSEETPDHRSLDVLRLINLVWGMQKKAAVAPVNPPTTVIGN
jgi:hypothetical protein